MGGKRGRKAEFTGSYECKNCGKIDIPGIETACVKETFITYGLLARLGTRKEEDELRECRLCRPCYARLNRLVHDLMGAERCQSQAQRPSKVRKTGQKVPIRDERSEDAPPDDDCPLITEELRRRLFEAHLDRQARNLAETRKILIVMLNTLTIMQTIFLTL